MGLTNGVLSQNVTDRITENERNRLRVIYVEAFYLLCLFAFAWLYLKGFLAGAALPASSIGRLPIGVPWFGALGAVIISLTGALDHRQDWDPSWASWHYTRPLVGASLAIVSWVIFQAGILAVGATPATQPAATTPKNLLFYLIAFVVGYREETFRDLIKRVADVILTPQGSSKAASPSIDRVNPSSGKAAGGDPVVITGSRLRDTVAVKFADAAAAVHVDSDAQITVTTPPGTPGVAPITVLTKDGSTTTSSFTYT